MRVIKHHINTMKYKCKSDFYIRLNDAKKATYLNVMILRKKNKQAVTHNKKATTYHCRTTNNEKGYKHRSQMPHTPTFRYARKANLLSFSGGLAGGVRSLRSWLFISSRWPHRYKMIKGFCYRSSQGMRINARHIKRNLIIIIIRVGGDR